MLYSMNVLSVHYKGAGKISTQEIFNRKTEEARNTVEMSAIYGLVANMRAELSEKLGALEAEFNRCSAKVDVAARVVDGKKTNVEVSDHHRSSVRDTCVVTISFLFNRSPSCGVK
jgi:uncharacterized protein YbbK (DUF523 family)